MFVAATGTATGECKCPENMEEVNGACHAVS